MATRAAHGPVHHWRDRRLIARAGGCGRCGGKAGDDNPADDNPGTTTGVAEMEGLRVPMAVLGRVLLGVYFLLPGITKITGFEAMLAYMTQHGVPFTAPLLVLTTVLQVGGGLALIAGWQVRWTAFMFAGMTLVINVFMHDFWNVYEGGSQAHEMQNFVKNLGIFAGLLMLAAHGAPNLSLDARRAR
jgi:putative oxidoreductase